MLVWGSQEAREPTSAFCMVSVFGDGLYTDVGAVGRVGGGFKCAARGGREGDREGA